MEELRVNCENTNQEETLQLHSWAEECELMDQSEEIQEHVENYENGEIVDSDWNEPQTENKKPNFVLHNNNGRKYKDIKRLKNIKYMMPFIMASHYFSDDDVDTNITFISSGICSELASNELRGKPYVINLNDKTKVGKFVNSKNAKSYIMNKLPKTRMSDGLKRVIKKDLHLNVKYDNNLYYVDPLQIVSFIFDKCTEARNRRPIIITWQSTQNMTFLCKHVIWEKNIVKCFLCDKVCNDYNLMSPDANDGTFFMLDENEEPQIICNVHNVPIAGLVNPVWINMIAVKYAGCERFQLEFKYENKITIYTVMLPKYHTKVETETKYLSISETDHLIGCRKQHGNPKSISGMLSYAKCIFTTFFNDICKKVEKEIINNF